MLHVLIVEDESSIAETLLFVLKSEGFSAHWESVAGKGLDYIRQHQVDLVIMDIGLPDITGFEACKQLRHFSDVPLIFLTARGEELDRVVGLEIGADDYIENYVQTLTHELKSPLAAIRASAELLQSPMPDEQRSSFIQNIDIESQRLQKLIDRLLNLAKIEHQQSLHQPVAIQLAELVQSILLRYQTRFEQKHIQLQMQLDDVIKILGEAFLLEQAICNLLDNALDFTPDKGKIVLSLVAEAEQLVLTVQNQGEVIPDYALPKLIDRFFSLPRPDTGKKSTGLGLNFVQEIMVLHKGKLDIANTDDGVIARLIFPR